MTIDIWLFCEIGQCSQRLYKLKIPNYIQTSIKRSPPPPKTTTFCALGAKNTGKFFLSLVLFNKERSAT